MNLTEVWEQLETALSHHAEFLTSVAPLEERLGHAESVAKCMEGFGICHLILDGDFEKFRLRFSEAASAIVFLRRILAERSLNIPLTGVSRTDAFFDALIAGNQQLTSGLALIFCATEWKDDGEPEGAYCYRQSLHSLWIEAKTGGTKPPGSDEWLARLEKTGHDIERSIISALRSRQSDALAKSVSLLLAREEEELKATTSQATDDHCWLWTKPSLSVHGLGILRLAEVLGIKVKESFPRCPPQALGALTELEFTDPFGHLDQIAEF